MYSMQQLCTYEYFDFFDFLKTLIWRVSSGQLQIDSADVSRMDQKKWDKNGVLTTLCGLQWLHIQS